jgi:hypothetical protein
MNTRVAAWLAWLLWALCLALAVLTVGFDIYTPPSRQVPPFAMLAAILLLVYPTIGALVVSRRPKNAVGWVLCAMGLIFEVLAFDGAYGIRWLTPWTFGPSLTLGAVLLILLFPDGKLPTSIALANLQLVRLWQAVVWLAISGAALVSFWWLTWPEGALGAVVRFIGSLGFGALLFGCVGTVVSAFLRWDSAQDEERQQLKWFAYGAALFLSAILFLLAAPEQTSGWVVFPVIMTGLLGIPVAVGIAILRHHLYDIDVVINRTLVYGALSILLALIYFGGVAATHTLLRVLTGQEEQPQLAIVVSTLVIAALFTPLRRRIQSFIDRSFYRKKYDARKTLEAFSAKLRNDSDLDALSDDLVGVVRETMQPAHVSLWLRPETSPKGEQTDHALAYSPR